MVDCETCGEPCPDPAKRCQWSGLFLCVDCAYDEGIEAEERHWRIVDGEEDEVPNGSAGSEGGNG